MTTTPRSGSFRVFLKTSIRSSAAERRGGEDGMHQADGGAYGEPAARCAR
jgi:hypothetical protein